MAVYCAAVIKPFINITKNLVFDFGLLNVFLVGTGQKSSQQNIISQTSTMETTSLHPISPWA